MQNSMVMFTFSVFDGKCPFWANLILKLDIVRLSWNLLPSWFEYTAFNRDVHLFFFWPKIPFFSKLDPESCQFKLKLGTLTNLNMQKSMVMFIFFCFWPSSLVQKINFAFWCYLINLPAVYSQRLEASCFSCSMMKLGKIKNCW